MNQWTETNNELKKTFVFSSFKDAIDWMVKASVEIDKQNHHPTWTNVFNKVHVCLTTHDEGNTITQKDIELAHALDTIEMNGSSF